MEIVQMSEMNRVTVDLGDRTYSVVVGHGAVRETASLLPSTAKRVAVVTQSGIPSSLIPQFPNHQVTVHEIGDGEEHKSLTTISMLCSAFAQAGLTRNDVVVGVGGGMVTDIAGFAAASYHRGIPVVHVATSLLAMIDAAVGGKTGVNIPEGKNLVGAYWQPHGVICDLDSLDSLPPREMRCGLGEMAKYHFIARENLDELDFAQRIARSIEIKSEIVAADEREGGVRALLNYGHTLAHAIEIETNFEMAHGEAVALGLLFAAHLGEVMGRITSDRVDEHYRVVNEVYGVNLAMPQGLVADRLIDAMGRDKKALESITFVLDSATGLEIVPGIREADIRTALAAFVSRVGPQA
jgi:5-deoxy-5-amino-3-dehydroquinate synthase